MFSLGARCQHQACCGIGHDGVYYLAVIGLLCLDERARAGTLHRQRSCPEYPNLLPRCELYPSSCTNRELQSRPVALSSGNSTLGLQRTWTVQRLKTTPNDAATPFRGVGAFYQADSAMTAPLLDAANIFDLQDVPSCWSTHCACVVEIRLRGCDVALAALARSTGRLHVNWRLWGALSVLWFVWFCLGTTASP